MQTVETLNEGLKRAYTLKIAANDIASRVDAEVKKAAPQVRMPGFRPGKVPANLIKKMHGPAMEREALQAAVNEGVQQLLAEQQLRPAMQPEVALQSDYEAGKDIEVNVALEVLPAVPSPDIADLTLERLTVEPSEDEISEQLKRFAGQSRSWADTDEGYAATTGDQVTVDFVGKTQDGVAFPGGTGTDMNVELGSGMLIPGFEEQMEGIKAGEDRVLNVTFPKAYQEKSLAGKPATFEITAKTVKQPKDTGLDDDFAKQLGLDSLDKLKELVSGQIAQELNGLTRTHMKRKLLDQLADRHDFEVPPSMVEAEFDQIWRQLEQEAANEPDVEAAKAEMESDRADYRKIAERRVRLGLLLSEIGQQGGVEVSAQEMQRLVAQAAQQYRPEDREKFAQWVSQDAVAAAQLRAPLYEDKVVDHLFATATITDRPATRAELEAAIEADQDGAPIGAALPEPHVHGPDCDHDHDHDHDHHGHDHAAEAVTPAKPKKAAAKKAAAPAEAEAEPVAEGAAPKKAAKPKAKAAPADEAPVEIAAEAPAEAAPKPKRAKKAAAE